MVVVGVDAHKRTHTLVAVDSNGQELGSVTVPTTSAGHLEAVKWVARFGEQRMWALEDCRNMTRRFESELLAAGETVIRVPTKMMASARKSARESGKSDPIDAAAVARAALREPKLPRAHLDGPAREVKLLVDYREALVRERTAAQNRLRWRLHELQPEFDPPSGSLSRYRTLDRTMAMLEHHTGLVADLARREVARIRAITEEANQLERQIRRLVNQVAPSLLQLPGCGSLSAAKLVGETAGVERFRSKDAFAMWTGAAPIPVWSGHPNRYRLNRGGNRQVNAALHRIAITQLRIHPDAQAYVQRRLAAGNTKKEALRALKRRLADLIYRTLLNDAAPSSTLHQRAAA
jgi:transposase